MVGRVLIAMLGLLAIVMAFVVYPVGIALTVLNVIMAIVTRGMERVMFVVFAVAGAVICIALGLFLPGIW